MKEQKVLSKFWFWGLLILPILLYFLLIELYGMNIPYVDDHGLKGFLVKFQDSKTWTEKIAAIFAQHNEHRIGLTRIWFLLVYGIYGSINYKWLMWFGNILLVGVVGIYVAYFKKNKISLLYFLPLPWILLTSINQENTYWGMASIQNFGIVFLSLWAFWELEEERLISALVLVSIAVFTSGNGFVTLAIMGGFLLLKQQWKNLGILVLLGVLLAYLYFATYQKPPATPSATLADLKKVLLAFVSFAGSAADVSLDSTISARTIKAILLGGILLMLALICVVRNIPFDFRLKKYSTPKNWPVFILATILLIVLSSFMVGWTRVVGYGMPTILTSRYKIYSLLFVITMYVWLLRVLEEKHRWRMFLFALPFSILTYVNGFWQSISQIDYHYKGLICNMFNWTYEDLSGKTNSPTQFRYYNPATVFGSLTPILLTNDFSHDPQIKLEEAKVQDGNVVIRGVGDFHFPWLDPDNGVYLIAKSEKRVYVFPLRSVKAGVRLLIGGHAVFGPYFENQIPTFEFDAGTYKLAILAVEDTQKRILNTQQSITIEADNRKAVETNW